MVLKKTKLIGDPTLLYCPGCSKYKRVEDGVYKTKSATNGNAQSAANGVAMTIQWIIICHECTKELVRPEDI